MQSAGRLPLITTCYTSGPMAVPSLEYTIRKPSMNSSRSEWVPSLTTGTGVAVQTPKEGYIVIHKDFERGWYPQAKSIVSYTDRAGLTVNNGARIVVTNLDIGVFAVDSYSTYGLESSTDPPAVGSGSMTVEFLSGDPSKNIYSLYPFVIAAVIGSLVGVLFLTKKRS